MPPHRRRRGGATAEILLAKRKRSEDFATVSREWTDLEQAFFDSAPPDEPGPPAEPSHLDELLPAARPGPVGLQRAPSRLRRILDRGARVLEGPTIWVVLATASLLVGLWIYLRGNAV